IPKQKTLTFYHIPPSQPHTLKTFHPKTYQLKPTIPIQNTTPTIQNLPQIYYQLPSLTHQHQNLIPKPKNKH
ncbi:hypothetical protein, partial [Bacillus thuringiensis]|uniref:hypothetical protein n=1 Tax=Bacillus thuringiensis TaxID=1428 RepID=UPI003BFA6D7F